MSNFAKKIRLSNGLTVIHEHIPHAEIISLNIGVRVGSSYESDDESGICHLIEHMVFKGTKSTQAGEIATLVESHGGELNAYTSLDQTVYYISLPKQHTKLGLHLLKEMVFDATFDATELEREKEVVVEEIRRGNDNPHQVLSKIIFNNLFGQHPYNRPVIGTEAHVRGFSAQKIRSFYDKHYVPSNMVLGICGHLTEEDLSPLLEELFRFVPNRVLESCAPTKLPAPKDVNIVYKAMPIQSTHFELAFLAPNLKHNDTVGLDMLSHLLGESETSRLERITKLKEECVHSIYTGCYTPRHQGLFMIGGQVDTAKISKALESIYRQVQYFKDNLIDEQELERAKLLALSGAIYQKQTCEGTARKWMSYETSGVDYQYDDVYYQALKNLTPQDIQRLAKQYLQFDDIVLGIVHNQNEKPRVAKDIFKKLSQQTQKPVHSFKKISQCGEFTLYKNSKGLRVILSQNNRLPIISIKTASLAGQRLEPKNKRGLSQLLSQMSTVATDKYSRDQLAETCEWLATGISCYTGKNSFGYSMTCLTEKLEPSLALLANVILNPKFNTDDLAHEKRMQIEAIKSKLDSPAHTAFSIAGQHLFANHPYEDSQLGTPALVKKFTAHDLKSWREQFLTTENIVFAIVGAIEPQSILAQCERHFESLPNRTKKSSPLKIKAPKPKKAFKSVFKEFKREQAHIVLGFLGVSIYDTDRFALEIINSILCGQGGRLFLELRDKQSLAYTVTANLMEGLDCGMFSTYIGTEPSKSKEAITSMVRELERLKTEPLDAVELARAKNYIIGNHAIDSQKNSAIASQVVLNELYDKPLKEYHGFKADLQKVTAKDIQKVAKKYFDLKSSILVVVGPKGTWTAKTLDDLFKKV